MVQVAHAALYKKNEVRNNWQYRKESGEYKQRKLIVLSAENH